MDGHVKGTFSRKGAKIAKETVYIEISFSWRSWRLGEIQAFYNTIDIQQQKG